MEVRRMKKYNTPEMKVAKFNEESITAAEVSNAFATYNAFLTNNNMTDANAFTRTWTELNEKGLNVTF
jgi:hypothetical protein